MNDVTRCMKRQIYSAPEKPSGAAVRDLQKRQDEERRLCSLFSFNKRVSKFHHYLMLFSGRLMVFVEHMVL